MGLQHHRRSPAVVAMLVAAVLVGGVGLHAGAQLAEETHRAALVGLEVELGDAVRVAGERVDAVLRRSEPAAATLAFDVHLASWARKERVHTPSPLGPAERAEFAQGDPARALALYLGIAEEARNDPTWRAEALRNAARLQRAAGHAERARASLEDAAALAGGGGPTALLVAYERTRLPGAPGVAGLRQALEAGAYAEAPPAMRVRLLDRLGASPSDAPALRALAASLRAPGEAMRLQRLPDGRVAWALDRTGETRRFALTPLPAVLGAVLPGMDAGRWELVPTGGHALPQPLFPAGVRVAPSRAALAEVEDHAAARRLTVWIPALAVSVLLAVASWAAARASRRRRVLAEQREAFLLSAAHELKTPVANVRLVADTLRGHGAEDPDAIARFAQILDAESRRLESRIHEMLLVAAADGAGPPPATAFDPLPIVHELVAARRADQGAPPRVHVALPHGTLALGRPLLFTNALDAVLDNAIKFGGSQSVHLRVDADEAHVRVQVEDGGPGIPEAQLEQVFEPFARLARDVDTAVPGTGLGLALARRCARACGGDVTARVRAQGGASVCVRLPRATERAA